MSVGRDGDLKTELLRHLTLNIAEIEPVRLGIEFKKAAALERRRQPKGLRLAKMRGSVPLTWMSSK
jgi:hypothetical protein